MTSILPLAMHESPMSGRAVGYTSMVGVSGKSDTIPRGAASGAYSTGRRVIALPRGVRP